MNSPYSQRLFFAPFLAALAFTGSGIALRMFLPAISGEMRLGAQAAFAAATVFLVMRSWKRAHSGGPPATLWTRTFNVILICSWWIAIAAWTLGFNLQAETDKNGHYLWPNLAIVDRLAALTFVWALACGVAAALVLGLLDRSRWPPLRQVFRDILKLVLFLSSTIVAFYLSAYLLRAVLPGVSPGFFACAQLVIAVAMLVIVLRVVAATTGVRPERAETSNIRPASLRIASQVVALSFVISFLAGVYMQANVVSQPDHRTGEYTVSERLGDGRVRYVTPLQSVITESATFTLFGSAVTLFALSYVLQRRMKKQTPLAEPRAGSES